MDQVKIGKLICTLRKEKQLTQSQLAAKMNISDKAVSQWECGMGCPDVSLLRRLYPEWGMQTRIPALAHGRLFWYCTRHGLFWQAV